MKILLFILFSTPLIFWAQSNIDHWESIAKDGSSYHYLIPVAQPDFNWMGLEFNSSNWLEGESGFGYGDGDDNTAVPAASSIYIRHEFELASLSEIEQVVFNMDYDDGFSAYLNGVEIARENLGSPGETIAWNAPLNNDHEAVLYTGGYPSTFTLTDFDLLLVEGTNVLAVEVHNVALGSSDLTARPFLHAGFNIEEETYSDTPDWFEAPLETCDEPNYTVVLNTAAWGNEVGWEIVTLNGGVIAGGENYADNSTIEFPVCLADDCYQFNMIDSYGDGWNGASFYMINDDAEIIIEGELLFGYEDYLIFFVNTFCDILGCTDSNAINYLEWANVDDGSCTVFDETNLPIVIISTAENIPDDPRIIAHMGIINNADGLNAFNDPFTDYNGRIEIERRGSSSQSFPKKSYALETQDSLGFNNNVSLVGMPAENDWILHGPYSDKTHMRNMITFELGRKVGRYTPRARYCELVINEDYRGIYMLMENIKRDENRVDIATLLPDDIEGDELTGGYILKVDKFTGDFEGGWTSPYPTEGGSELTIQFHKPEIDELAEEQIEYIQDHVTEFETALAGSNFTDSVIGYAPYIDECSFIDLYLINEFSRNIDGYRLSTYFHKQKDSNGGKLVMGPWWDYNLSFANADYCQGWEIEGWEVESDCGNDNPFWFERLLEDSAYSNLTRCKWEDYRSDAWSDESIHGLIDSLEISLATAHVRNFLRWETLGEYVWPNYYIGQTYAEEVQILRDWIDDRLFWLDENIDGTCSLGCIDELACNYSSIANYDDESCIYAEPLYDCDGSCLNDYDVDEVCDAIDNCPAVYNPLQTDTDVDGVCDEIDNCPEVYNPSQIDSNGDGFGDECQPVSILENQIETNATLIAITDILGRRVSANADGVLFFTYSDGSVVRKVILTDQQ